MHSQTFKVIIYYIRGYGKCSLLLIVKSQQLHIQVIEQKEILEVPKEILLAASVKDLNLRLVKKIVTAHIYYDKYTKGFYWQDESDPSILFSSKDSHSKLLDEHYLKHALRMKRFKVLYSFTVVVQDVEFRVEMQGLKNQVRCKISSERECVEIPQESKYIKILTEMQCIDILTNPITLQTSLEIQILIKRQFPRMFSSKSKRPE